MCFFSSFSNFNDEKIKLQVSRICSSWTKLHNELVCLKESFYAYHEDFINKCFKKVMDNIHVVKETTLQLKRSLLS